MTENQNFPSVVFCARERLTKASRFGPIIRNFYIIECKPKFDINDKNKILNVLSSNSRLYSFCVELKQYRLLDKVHYTKSFEEFSKSVQGVLAYSGVKKTDETLHHLVVKTWTGMATWY